MGKNKISKQRLGQLQLMRVKEMGKEIASGNLSIKELKQAYTQMRDIAVKRIARLNTEKNISEFGKPSEYTTSDYFRKLKNIVTTSELVREFADLSRFLNSERSTIKGLKKQREDLIETMQESGFEVDKKDYPELLKFLKWFKSSEYSKKYDSDSPIVAEVFNSERANPNDWKRAFEQFSKTQSKSKNPPVRKY